jgi:hypothetical protein
MPIGKVELITGSYRAAQISYPAELLLKQDYDV